MKALALCLIASLASAAAQTMPSMPMNGSPVPGEQLGTVSFVVACAPGTQPAFNRGVALLHDFWYAESEPQFQRMVAADPACAMAHWGLAMSSFHQIWDRPSEAAMKLGWAEMEKAQALPAATARERAYIAALAGFYKPGSADFMARITAYSAAMGVIYQQYPGDVDAGAFYALALLAARAPNDATVTQDRAAMEVLKPLFISHPDHPGVVHYIIHSCDNPSMAAQGLAAAEHYEEIAPSGPHAVHMSGHIFSRLGLWPQDIASQLAAIRAAEAAEAHQESGLMDEPHSYDFLMYAYLQTGQDAEAEKVLKTMPAVMDRVANMPGTGAAYMSGMLGYYRAKFPIFYALERRNWQDAGALLPPAGATPETAAQTWWARAVGHGQLHEAEQARMDLTAYDELMAEVRKGKRAYLADSTGSSIVRHEIVAWSEYASGRSEDALKEMRAAADLQDKVGQGEVDIPAREMLADMLLEMHRSQEALMEYRVALQLSPNRFNGLYHAGQAAEQSKEQAVAAGYYSALLKSAADGESARPELAHAKNFLAGSQLAVK